MEFQLLNFDYTDAFTFAHHERNYSFQEHIHQHAELVLIEDGEINVTVGGKLETARSGDFIFIFPFLPHKYKSYVKSTFEMYTFSPSLLARFFDLNKGKIGEKAVFRASDCSRALFKSKLIEGKRLDRYSIKTCLYSMLCDFNDSVKLIPYETDGTLLTKLILCVRDNINTQIPLTEVAKKIGYSPNYLSHCIKKTIGISYSKLLGTIRAEEARIMLEGTTKSSNEIALECGFGSERTFHRQFKEYCRLTPQEYRKRNSERYVHPSLFYPNKITL